MIEDYRVNLNMDKPVIVYENGNVFVYYIVYNNKEYIV